jgi:hypothetical protein
MGVELLRLYHLTGKEIPRPGTTAIIVDTASSFIFTSNELVRHIYALLNGYFNTTYQQWLYHPTLLLIDSRSSPYRPAAGENNVTLLPRDFKLRALANDWIIGTVQQRNDIGYDVVGSPSGW